jgi:hypothetical protein
VQEVGEGSYREKCYIAREVTERSVVDCERSYREKCYIEREVVERSVIL